MEELHNAKESISAGIQSPASLTITDKLAKRKQMYQQEIAKIESIEKFLAENPNFQQFHDLMRNINI